MLRSNYCNNHQCTHLPNLFEHQLCAHHTIHFLLCVANEYLAQYFFLECGCTLATTKSSCCEPPRIYLRNNHMKHFHLNRWGASWNPRSSAIKWRHDWSRSCRFTPKHRSTCPVSLKNSQLTQSGIKGDIMSRDDFWRSKAIQWTISPTWWYFISGKKLVRLSVWIQNESLSSSHWWITTNRWLHMRNKYYSVANYPYATDGGSPE